MQIPLTTARIHHAIKREYKKMFKPVTYSLYGNGEDRESFYRELSHFADEFYPYLQESIGADAVSYMEYIRAHHTESVRYYGEYLLEPLIAGVLWNEYGAAAQKSSALAAGIVSFLYKIRKINLFVKEVADYLRGYALNMIIHDNTKIVVAEEITLKKFIRLNAWLSATGDFREESSRLSGWISYLKTLARDEQKRILNKWADNARIFSEQTRETLGQYTKRVNAYRQNVPVSNRNRENRIFCARAESEYHLNMFAAEILNREYKKDFDSKREKIVLLPTCMRGGNARRCRAVTDGNKTRCARCTEKCGINRVTTALEKHGVQTSLIPHSSDFTRFLKKWENSGSTGLIGVACVLNLLTGGYEMRRLGISSQCVFLDFSGCSKHWDSEGTATSLYIQRLFDILGINK
jgi:uncharacterized protein